MPITKIKIGYLVAFLAAIVFITSCQLQQKASHPSYSYKTKKNPKFINGISMGGHGQKSISLDDVVEENEPEITEEADNTPTQATPPPAKQIKYSYTAPTSVKKKSKIKVGTEEKEPEGLKLPSNAFKPVNNSVASTVNAASNKPISNTVNNNTSSLNNTPVQKTMASVTKTVSQTMDLIENKYAEMLGVLPTAICNPSLYQFIDEWYGVRYHFGGTSKNGVDCSAFVQQLYEHVFGTNLLRTAIEQFTTSVFVKKSGELEEGDLVFFHIHSKHITHVGIYLANNYFVHASRSQGVTISNLNDSYWKKYYAGAGKRKG